MSKILRYILISKAILFSLQQINRDYFQNRIVSFNETRMHIIKQRFFCEQCWRHIDSRNALNEITFKYNFLKLKNLS